MPIEWPGPEEVPVSREPRKLLEAEIPERAPPQQGRASPVRVELDALIEALTKTRHNLVFEDSALATRASNIFAHADQINTVIGVVGKFLASSTKAVHEEFKAVRDSLATEITNEFEPVAPVLEAAVLTEPLKKWMVLVEENYTELDAAQDALSAAAYTSGPAGPTF